MLLKIPSASVLTFLLCSLKERRNSSSVHHSFANLSTLNPIFNLNVVVGFTLHGHGRELSAKSDSDRPSQMNSIAGIKNVFHISIWMATRTIQWSHTRTHNVPVHIVIHSRETVHCVSNCKNQRENHRDAIQICALTPDRTLVTSQSSWLSLS